MKRILRWLLVVCTWLHLVGVIGYWVLLRFIGESWWWGAIVIYLPHVLLLAPMVVLTPLLAILGPRKLIVGQLVIVPLVLFPIMGLRLGGAVTPTEGTPRLRLLSYNVERGKGILAEVTREIIEVSPDIVLIQEATDEVEQAVAQALPGYTTNSSGEFVIVSRFPVLELIEPPKVIANGIQRSPRFVHYIVATPLGLLELFNLHPFSPREGFETLRGGGLLYELRHGSIWRGDSAQVIANLNLRRAQVTAVAEAARAARHPVIIAGDTNLPGSSQIFAETLGGWRDGFTAVGRGFGYTYPAHKGLAWLRLDRILAGPELRFLDFSVGARHGSDHYCVYADLERAP